ncbi:AraC family transcriptional regulator [bacterium]|nr:AraC family transcriptional regulator [bacterium]
MNTTVEIDLLSVFIFLGVFLGLLLSFFFIFKRSSNAIANKYQGLLLLTISLCILEQFLNITGYIVRMLPITNVTEPLNLVIGPLLYLFVRISLEPSGMKRKWIHFVPFIFYSIYICFDLVQTNEFKYNSYVNSIHPDWPLLDAQPIINNDPLNIKKHLNLVTASQILLYVVLSFTVLWRKSSGEGKSIFRTDDELLRSLRNMVFHITVIMTIFIVVKLNFQGDVGDYFIGLYVSVFTILTTLRVMNDSTYFDRSRSFMDLTMEKYRKSSLNEHLKQQILNSIREEFEKKEYFTEGLASLSDLARRIGESPHHVSQVINEKLEKNFFELLASYRVEKAKKILEGDKTGRLTVEEVSEMVGYNSKTAFNNSFKKITGKTPSEFRKSAISR